MVRGDSSLTLRMLGVAALAQIAAGCDGGACTERACFNMEHLQFSVVREVDGDVSAEFCRKDLCGQAVIAASSLQAVGRFPAEITFEGPSSAEPRFLICVTSTGKASAVCVVSWVITSPERIAKGDELSVRLSAAGQELASRSGRVSLIGNEYPNGDDCGAGCQTATVDVSE